MDFMFLNGCGKGYPSTNAALHLRPNRAGHGIYYDAYTEREDAEGREKYLESGAGRRFLRSQLRYYLKKFPARAAM